jgi:ubiquinone/menaquinone biosynthesis C-methylase UbiE
MNRVIWENWDWSAKGEEWTPSPEWKRSVIEHLLRADIPDGAAVLEIGPGGGRWTEELQQRSKRLTGLDISAACVRTCQARFLHCDNVDFRVGSGSDLDGVPDASVDAIWSFDVFVHVDLREFRAYTAEFARVLRPGGIGVIHHGGVGGSTGGWRSNVTGDDVLEMLRSTDLEVVERLSSWWDNGCEYHAGLYGDAVTIFRMPFKDQGKAADYRATTR